MSTAVLSNEEAKRNISANLRKLMDEAKLSLRDIGKVTGESHTAIDQYSRGEKMPGAGPLARLAECFTKALGRKITVDSLLSPSPNGRGKNLRKASKDLLTGRPR